MKKSRPEADTALLEHIRGLELQIRQDLKKKVQPGSDDDCSGCKDESSGPCISVGSYCTGYADKEAKSCASGYSACKHPAISDNDS